MNADERKEAEQKTNESRTQAANEAKNNTDENKVTHTVNPFTGTEIEITSEDLEGVEKKIEADTERD